MVLVDLLAREHGVHRQPPGKTVWASVTRRGRASLGWRHAVDPRRPARAVLARRPLDLDALRARSARPARSRGRRSPRPEAAARSPRLPELDRTDLALVTIDPVGSTDLDQAVHVRARRGLPRARTPSPTSAPSSRRAARSTRGRAARRHAVRPDRRVPLHPPVPRRAGRRACCRRPAAALLWQLDLDADGELTATDVRRALVRSRAQLDYEGVQRDLDDGTAPEPLQLLREVGRLRQAGRASAGRSTCPRRSRRSSSTAPAGPTLVLRAQLPVERWNASISLLTGAAAADLMLDAEVGLLRTLPPAPEQDVEALRRSAIALGVDWPAGRRTAPSCPRSTPPTRPPRAARAAHAAAARRRLHRLRRRAAGAGAAQRGGAAVRPLHRPLRRLADRHVGEVCLAVAAGEAVPSGCAQRCRGCRS
jgi:hypothetical protein